MSESQTGPLAELPLVPPTLAAILAIAEAVLFLVAMARAHSHRGAAAAPPLVLWNTRGPSAGPLPLLPH